MPVTKTLRTLEIVAQAGYRSVTKCKPSVDLLAVSDTLTRKPLGSGWRSADPNCVDLRTRVHLTLKCYRCTCSLHYLGFLAEELP